MPPVSPKHTDKKRVHFDLLVRRNEHSSQRHNFSQFRDGRGYGRRTRSERGSSRNFQRGRKHGCKVLHHPIPNRGVPGHQSRSERGRKGSCDRIHFQTSWDLQPYNQQESPTHRRDELDVKAFVLNMIVQPLNPVSEVLWFAKSQRPSVDIQLMESTIQAEFQSLYSEKRLEVQNAVNAESNLVLSAELWSSSDAMSYLTVSCHLINENWMQKSYVLDTAHLPTERKPEHVVKQLVRISKEWNITEKIEVVVTNIDDMKKVDKSVCKWTFIPCFAHTLDKVFRETIGETVWKHLLGKCQHIVAFFHQTNKASQSLKNHCSHLKCQQSELIQSSDLRWLPTLHMLKNILEMWPAIHAVLVESKVYDLCLTENEIKILNDIVAVLNILKDVTQNLGSQEYSYSPISSIIPLVQKLQEEVRNLEMMENSIAKMLSERCDYHIGGIKKNNWFRICTALDPRHKHFVLWDHGVEEVKTEIISQMRGNTNTVYKKMILEKYCKIRNISENPLEFWKTRAEFEQLATVTRKYLTVVSTAIPVKYVYQLEKSQAINRRTWLEPKNLNMIMFLYNN